MDECCFGRIVGELTTLKKFCVEFEKAQKKMTAVATTAGPLAENTDEWDEFLEAGFPCCHISPCPPPDCFWVPPTENWHPDVDVSASFGNSIALEHLLKFLEVLDGGHGGVELNYSHPMYASRDEDYADFTVHLMRNSKEECWILTVRPRLIGEGVPEVDVIADWHADSFLPKTGLNDSVQIVRGESRAFAGPTTQYSEFPTLNVQPVDLPFMMAFAEKLFEHLEEMGLEIRRTVFRTPASVERYQVIRTPLNTITRMWNTMVRSPLRNDVDLWERPDLGEDWYWRPLYESSAMSVALIHGKSEPYLEFATKRTERWLKSQLKPLLGKSKYQLEVWKESPEDRWDGNGGR